MTYRLSRADLCHAVWMHTVHLEFKHKGWPVRQCEMDEAVSVFEQARDQGLNVPSIGEACDYFNGG